jgi:hypothetical protein
LVDRFSHTTDIRTGHHARTMKLGAQIIEHAAFVE